MKLNNLTSIFDEPIRKLEKDFFSRRNDTYSWPNDRRPLVLQRPELLDRREYSEIMESKIEDEEIAKCTENELLLKISCIEFRPEEITVTVEDNQLLIEGMQERKTENGKTKRFFRRQIQLPDDSLTKEMNCTAKLNGLLSISIPRKNKNEKIIPIRLETNSSASNLNQQRFNQTIHRSNSQTKTANPIFNEAIINRTDSQISNQSQLNQQTIPKSSQQQSNQQLNQQSNPQTIPQQTIPQLNQQSNSQSNQTQLSQQQNQSIQQLQNQQNSELPQTQIQQNQSISQLPTQLSMNLTSPNLINRQQSTTIVTN